jgi:L-asparaginase
MPSPECPDLRIVILGTGGTIAGTAAAVHDHVGYRSAQLEVAALVAALEAAVPPLAGRALECEQLAQLDSKDMDFATWQRLAQRAAHHLARPEVAGVVVTHGTDTLEETAYFLHRVLAPAKPLVLTAAMRPATALSADGPQNLLDAVTAASAPGLQGVVAVLAGEVHAAQAVRKAHTYRLAAFTSGDAGPLAVVEQGRLRWLSTGARDADRPQALGLDAIAKPAEQWPWVELLASHAGARGDVVRALVAAGVRGLVVAGVGNGNLHREWETALRDAAAAGVAIRRASRCAAGAVVGDASPHAAYGALGAVKSRVELLLELLSRA